MTAVNNGLAAVIESIPTPTTLGQAIAERNNWIESAMMFSQNEDFYRGLVVQIGEMFGDAAKTSDDGSLQQSVLALRVPELVAELLQSRAAV